MPCSLNSFLHPCYQSSLVTEGKNGSTVCFLSYRYVTLPFEIRTQEYLLVLYDRLSNLKQNPARDVSAKFPDEFKKYVEGNA